jgi:hypothetical protein
MLRKPQAYQFPLPPLQGLGSFSENEALVQSSTNNRQHPFPESALTLRATGPRQCQRMMYRRDEVSSKPPSLSVCPYGGLASKALSCLPAVYQVGLAVKFI